MKEIQTKRIPCFKRWTRTGWAAFASLHRPVTIGVLSVTMSILLPAAAAARVQVSDSLEICKILQIDEVGITGNLSSPTRSVVPPTTLFDRKAGVRGRFKPWSPPCALRPKSTSESGAARGCRPTSRYGEAPSIRR